LPTPAAGLVLAILESLNDQEQLSVIHNRWAAVLAGDFRPRVLDLTLRFLFARTGTLIYNSADPGQSLRTATQAAVRPDPKQTNTQGAFRTMKKLLTLLFAMALALSLSAGAFAQDSADKPAETKKEAKAEKKAAKKKAKKDKKAAKEENKEMKDDMKK
jgi:hypothetical protein